EKTTVKRIAFTGNTTFAAYRLKGVIKSAETGLLSFLTSNDLYDPDRIEADRDLLRRFYLKHGYVDVRIGAARAELDPAAKGIVITFAVDEGQIYRIGAVDVQSNLQGVEGRALSGRVHVRSGDVFDADAVEKSADDLTIELARRGEPFASVR